MRTIFLSLIFVLGSIALSAQETPVNWKIDIKHIENQDYELSFRADIDKGWNVYSQFTSPDGPVPTEISYETSGFEKLGKAVETGHKKEGYDKLFSTDVIKFLDDEPFIIKQKLRIEPTTKKVIGWLSYMTCDSKRCLPPQDVDFDLDVPNFKPLDSQEEDKVEEVKSETVSSAPVVKKVDAPKKVEEVKNKVEVLTNKVQDKASQVAETTKSTVASAATQVAETKTKLVDNVKSNNSNSTISFDESVLDKSGNDNPVNWSFDLVKINDEEYELKYTAAIDDDWNVYSQYTDDNGPVPTYIEYEVKEGVELLGKATEEGHRKEGKDPLFDNVMVIKFLGDEDFTITQKVKANKDSKIKGYLSFMTCDASHCMPPQDIDFEVDFASNYFGAPKPEPETATTNLIDGKVDQRIPSITASVADPVNDCGGDEETDGGLLTSFILGFLGGLVALITPCVFPMIPLTVSYFLKDTNRSGLANGLIYGLSIIVIYVSMGLLITSLFGTEALNQLSTDAIANTIFFLIFVFFAFSFFGYYELTLPSSWTTKTDAVADKGGILGIFFMAFTLALVSFSCTGPIIGSALVSSTSSTMGPAIVMTGFSLALALPFGLFAAFPTWLNSLPRSGGWMTNVKVILGFLELAFAFKFLSVADMTSHWNFLKYELFLGIWVICALAMSLYLFGKIRFPHDSPIKKLSNFRKGLALAFLALAIYLATGFRVNPENPNSYVPKALTSGIAPPASYNFFLPDPVPKEASKEEFDAIKAKYPSYTFCANNIPCFKEYDEALAHAKEVGQPLFLDFTGHGCVNCRKTEEFIWVDPEVKRKLTDEYILVSLYCDDREKLEETLYSIRQKNDGTNVKMRTVGHMWSDFQIVNFNRLAQPLYVIMTNEEQVVSKTRGYQEGIFGYDSYLTCGLETISRLK